MRKIKKFLIALFADLIWVFVMLSYTAPSLRVSPLVSGIVMGILIIVHMVSLITNIMKNALGKRDVWFWLTLLINVISVIIGSYCLVIWIILMFSGVLPGIPV